MLVITGLALVLASCGWGPFNEGRCANAINGSPIRLDGEQVLLTKQQVDCGVNNDLWEPPQDLGSERSTAHLVARGQALKFGDDVIVAEPGQGRPYVQVRGEFPVQVLEIVNMRDNEPGVKLIEVRLGIIVQHSCFATPLPLMGVRKGKFTQDVNPVVRLKQDGDSWIVDRLVH